MWNFRNFTAGFFLILFFFNIIAIFSCPCDHGLLNFFCTCPLLFYSILVFLFLMVPVVLSFFPCLEFHHKPVICRIKTKEKQVLLTFDDGPDPGITPKILDLLEQHGIKAIFFVIGKKIVGNEELIRKIAMHGHVVGNHSYSHTKLWDFKTGRKIREEILLTSDVILKATGIAPTCFRPPYGVINPMVHKGLRNTGLAVVAWSRRSLDTISGNERKIIGRITRNLRPGDILLFHDTSAVTAGCLESMFLEVKARGYRFANPGDILNTKNDA